MLSLRLRSFLTIAALATVAASAVGCANVESLPCGNEPPLSAPARACFTLDSIDAGPGSQCPSRARAAEVFRSSRDDGEVRVETDATEHDGSCCYTIRERPFIGC